MTDKIFIYYRVSTKKQADAGTIQNQKRAVQSFLKDKDVTVMDTFIDEALSGANTDRPGYQAMIARLDEVDGIAVYDLDRLSRNYEDAAMLCFKLQSIGKRLYLARTNIIEDWSKEHNILVQQIVAWGADQERKRIKQRQKDGIERYKLHHGGAWGKPVKKVNWREYDYYASLKIGKRKIAKMMGMHVTTLYARLKDRNITATNTNSS
jgi:DNA invertase Pin-like site-specific DNA recombinase